MFEELSPPYATIVADPPWDNPHGGTGQKTTRDETGRTILTPVHQIVAMPYSTMTALEVEQMDVRSLAAPDAHLYLWVTNQHLRAAYGIAESWGFTPIKPLVWCKAPKGPFMGGAFGGASIEFCLFARRGKLAHTGRAGRQWWEWPRSAHSVKPGGFMDIVEQVSPGPYLELFARQPRLGWDAWGFGHETKAS